MHPLLTLLPLTGCLASAYAGGDELPGYDGRFVGDPTLSPKELALTNDHDLRRLRNEVFAQYGRAFASEDLAAYFAKKPWYHPDPNFSEERLTANDKANVALIASLEGNRRDEQRKVGEYLGVGYRLLLVGERDCEIITGDDMYDWVSQPCHWESRGQWVLTYTSGSWPSPSGSMFLWRLDDAKQAVRERVQVGLKQG